jgi:hypothetical protein
MRCDGLGEQPVQTLNRGPEQNCSVKIGFVVVPLPYQLQGMLAKLSRLRKMPDGCFANYRGRIQPGSWIMEAPEELKSI